MVSVTFTIVLLLPNVALYVPFPSLFNLPETNEPVVLLLISLLLPNTVVSMIAFKTLLFPFASVSVELVI